MKLRLIWYVEKHLVIQAVESERWFLKRFVNFDRRSKMSYWTYAAHELIILNFRFFTINFTFSRKKRIKFITVVSEKTLYYKKVLLSYNLLISPLTLPLRSFVAKIFFANFCNVFRNNHVNVISSVSSQYFLQTSINNYSILVHGKNSSWLPTD